jgi:hypothetical protein
VTCAKSQPGLRSRTSRSARLEDERMKIKTTIKAGALRDASSGLSTGK